MRRTTKDGQAGRLGVAARARGGGARPAGRALGPVGGGPASAEELEPQVTRDVRVAMSDGVELEVRLGGRGPLVDGELPARPVIVEFSPYGPGCCVELAGPEFNYLQVHIRGTGLSDGVVRRPRARARQQDVAEVLGVGVRAAVEQRPPRPARVLGQRDHRLQLAAPRAAVRRDARCSARAPTSCTATCSTPAASPTASPALGVFGAHRRAARCSAVPDRFGRDPLSARRRRAGHGPARRSTTSSTRRSTATGASAGSAATSTTCRSS